MNLIIDIGNTAVKVALFENDRLVWNKRYKPAESLHALQKLFKSHSTITHSIISSVAKTDKQIIKLVSSKTERFNLSHKTPLPFINRYKTPSTWGLDRLAAVAGAQKQFPKGNVLVIDAGTCITYDFMNKKGEYFGGSISPGLKMRFEALHNFTARLPLLKPEPVRKLTGDSTKNSILTGVVLGMTNEINGFIKQYKAEYHELNVILTGGDAIFLGRQLKSSIFVAPYLTLEGLNEILKFDTGK